MIRKRIAPLIFILAMGLLVRETCQKADRAHATVVLELGAAEAKVRQVDVTLHVDGDELSVFHRVAPPGLTIGPIRFDVSMPSRDGELRVDVRLDTATKHVVRKIHAEDGAVMTVKIGDELL
jgi:hypothetical protein